MTRAAWILALAGFSSIVGATPLFCTAPSANSMTCSGRAANVTASSTAGSFVLTLAIDGEYDLPTVDPNSYSVQSLSATLTGDIGGAEWSVIPANSLTYAAVEGGWGLNYSFNFTPISATNVAAEGRAVNDVFDHGDLYSLVDFPVSNLPPTAYLSTGSIGDRGGYVPVALHVVAEDVVSPEANEFVFVENPVLTVVYTLVPVSSNGGNSISSASFSAADAGSQAFYMAGNSAVPGDLAAQLPSYLGLSSVTPEPSSIILVGLGFAGLLLRSAVRARGESRIASGGCILFAPYLNNVAMNLMLNVRPTKGPPRNLCVTLGAVAERGSPTPCGASAVICPKW